MASVSSYLKAAASELRRAAEIKKREMDEARREIDRQESEKRAQVNDLKREEMVKAARANDVDDNQDRARLVAQVSSLRSEESKVEQEKDQTKSSLAGQISAAERDMNSLLTLAGDLERRASSM
jgi:hypothetical protein